MKSYIADYLIALGDSKRQLPFMLLIMTSAALLDMLGVGLIGPLLANIMGQEVEVGPFAWLAEQPYAILASAVLGAFAMRGLIGYWLQRRVALFGHRHRARLMDHLLASYQNEPLEFHAGRDTSRSVTSIIEYTAGFSESTLAASMRMLTDVFVLVAISVLLAITDFKMFTAVVVVLGAVVLGINLAIRKKVRKIGRVASEQTVSILNSTSAALEGYRDIRVLGAEKHFRDKLFGSAMDLANHRAWLQALGVLPRYVIEVAVIALMLGIGGVALQAGVDMQELVPVLASFAFGAMRMMPTASSLIRNLNQMRMSRPMLGRLAQDLRKIDEVREAPPPPTASIPFDVLSTVDLGFQYPGSSRWAIQDVSMSIRQGEVIGLVGRSGAGKSTLADLLLGLLTPTSGQLMINGEPVRSREIRGLAAYVPQNSFLVSDTLMANVALGVPTDEVSPERLEKALEQAQLAQLVAELKQGVHTRVGERGTTLSGGQRQRVALARALYFERPLIILDEATSALDEETEKAMVDALDTLAGERTLLVIAHRKSTLAHCSRILKLQQGRLIES